MLGRRKFLQWLGLGGAASAAPVLAAKPRMVEPLPAELEHFTVGEVGYIGKLNALVDAVNEIRRTR